MVSSDWICLLFPPDKCVQLQTRLFSFEFYSLPILALLQRDIFFLFLQINRSVEKRSGSLRAVYWKSGRDGSCSAGVCSLSSNANQMLMNQAIVARPVKHLHLNLPENTHTHTHTLPSQLPVTQTGDALQLHDKTPTIIWNSKVGDWTFREKKQGHECQVSCNKEL